MKLLRYCVVAFFIFACIFGFFWVRVPQEDLLKWQRYSSLYYDASGTLLRMGLADDDRYRIKTDIKKLPQELIKATVLYEDRFFYHHPGVNVFAIYKAFISTYFTGSRRMGASTITMQVARIAFNLRSKTVLGKIQQIFYALWLEQHYTKNELLEIYFNAVSYGGNIEGIEAASQIYFHKEVEELNLPEILSLTVIPQNPVKRNIQTPQGYKKMLEARAVLFQKYQDEYGEDLSQEEKKRQALWMKLPLNVYASAQLPFYAPHFINYIKKKNPYLEGKVETSLNYKKQTTLERELKAWLRKKKDLGLNNAAALLINTQDMGIEAWVGSANFFNKNILGQVDAITAKRSPGSTLKPFVYALAMDQGLIHPQSLLEDAPYRFGAYTPENFDKVFLGPISATQALITSRNVPAVRLASKLEKPSLYEFLQKAKISKMRSAEHYGMSIALGGMEVSMLELARLYATLANKGELKALHYLKEEASDESLPLLTAESAWLTLNMLKKNPPPGLKDYIGLEKKKLPFSWKTGTSYAFRDAWSVGISKKYVLLVWVGNFDGKGNSNFVGRKAAAPLFFNIMQALEAEDVFQNNSLVNDEPLNLALVDICKTTGMLPGKLCPNIEKSWFIPGISPIRESNIYRQIPINIKTGERECFHIEGKSKMQTYEFWPSNLLRLFTMAGIKKQSVPPLKKVCAELQASKEGMVPQIQSPAKHLIYTLEEGKEEHSFIPFQAILDADAHKAFWFVNEESVGVSKPSQAYFWKPRLGEYRVQVVDEKGLSSSVDIRVELAN